MESFKSLFAVIVFSISMSVAFAQSPTSFSDKTDKESFETLSDYHKYISSIDVAALPAQKKKWLEDEYNRLIKKMDKQHHDVTEKPVEQSATKNQIATYSYVVTPVNKAPNKGY